MQENLAESPSQVAAEEHVKDADADADTNANSSPLQGDEREDETLERHNGGGGDDSVEEIISTAPCMDRPHSAAGSRAHSAAGSRAMSAAGNRAGEY